LVSYSQVRSIAMKLRRSLKAEGKLQCLGTHDLRRVPERHTKSGVLQNLSFIEHRIRSAKGNDIWSVGRHL
jgi:hypothetical protein